MSRVIKIIGIVLFLGLVLTQRELVLGMVFPKTAYAVGDLEVDFGVAAGQPIFTVANSYPGQSIVKTVTVTNNSSNTQPLGLRGNLINQTGQLATVLSITVQETSTTLYSGKKLAEFFDETTLPNFVSLGNIAAGQTKSFSITITFDTGAGNEYQNKSATFDLHIGIAYEIPTACQNITFSGQPKFGTQGNDRINGTSRNDLIIGLEGNDRIDGGSGNDCIIGGIGNDTIRGGSGNDVLAGEAGNDQISGGSGNDRGTGIDGNDAFDGGSGNDIFEDILGINTFKGGSGNDTLLGNILTDLANGEAGNDTCIAKTKIKCEN